MATCLVGKIDSNVTGLRSALEVCLKELPDGIAVAARGNLTFASNPAAAATVTIGAVVYTFRAALSAGPTIPNEILIGVNAAASAANLVAAIMAGAGVGVTYSTGTVVHPTVSATLLGNVVTAVAKTAGTAGNAIVTTSSSAAVVAQAATLAGGAAAVVAEWDPVEPNSYSDFGTQSTLVARNPINPSRQRKKGVITNREAAVGYNIDFTFNSLQKHLQGAMYALFRTKPSYHITPAAAVLSVTAVPGGFPTLNSTAALDLTTLGLTPGDWVFIGGDGAAQAFANAANNGFKRVRSITATTIAIDKSYEPMVTEAGAGLTVHLYLGRVLKNELGALIERQSYTFERTLGSLDGMDPPQAEYVNGAVLNELVLNFPSADKITADLTFIGCEGDTRTQAEGLMPGTRPAIVESDAFNTSTDLRRERLAIVSPTEAVEPLFGFVLESSLSINNNATGNIAHGIVGNFEVTAGTFQVGGSITAYFSDVRAVRAVQNNEDITLDYLFVKDNQGVIIDMPLLSLGDGRPNVELDQPITLPLTPEAASGAKIDATLDYTLLWVFFDTLPNLAAE